MAWKSSVRLILTPHLCAWSRTPDAAEAPELAPKGGPKKRASKEGRKIEGHLVPTTVVGPAFRSKKRTAFGPTKKDRNPSTTEDITNLANATTRVETRLIPS